MAEQGRFFDFFQKLGNQNEFYDAFLNQGYESSKPL
jgi:hypothetical protein